VTNGLKVKNKANKNNKKLILINGNLSGVQRPAIIPGLNCKPPLARVCDTVSCFEKANANLGQSTDYKLAAV